MWPLDTLCSVPIIHGLSELAAAGGKITELEFGGLGVYQGSTPMKGSGRKQDGGEGDLTVTSDARLTKLGQPCKECGSKCHLKDSLRPPPLRPCMQWPRVTSLRPELWSSAQVDPAGTGSWRLRADHIPCELVLEEKSSRCASVHPEISHLACGTRIEGDK